jgi:hypothetical protein
MHLSFYTIFISEKFFTLQYMLALIHVKKSKAYAGTLIFVTYVLQLYVCPEWKK